jgi:hypothetical protein
MAITLGLVEAVDDNGVYVTMPGSRGLLRGPYRTLSTVAAGTTVLVASTDDGEQVVVGTADGGDGVYNVRAFGAKGDGTTDDTTAIQAAMTAGAGATVLFPPGDIYRITDAVSVSTGTTVVGYGATIRQDTKHKMCLDVVMRDDVTVLGLTFLTTLTRTYTGGTSARYDNVYALWAGIYASGNRLTVCDCTFDGFTCGLCINRWNGTDRTGDCDGFTISDCKVARCDFGILGHEVVDLLVDGFSGSWEAQSGSGAAPHLVYIAEADNHSANVTIRRVHGFDSPAGHCVQIKDTIGAAVHDVSTDNCAGLFTVRDSSHVSVRGLSATNDNTPTIGTVYMQEGCSDVAVDGVLVSTVSPTPAAGRAGRITGERICASNLVSFCDWSSQEESAEWLVDGAEIDVRGVTSLNRSSYGAVVVQVTSASTAVTVADVRATNCRTGVNYNGSATGAVDVNVDQITNGSSITSPTKVVTVAGVKATLSGDELLHSGTKVGFYGTTPATKPTVTGSRGGNAALGSLLTQLASLGLLTDSSSS